MPPCLALSIKGWIGGKSLRHTSIMSRGCTCTSSCLTLQKQEIGSSTRTTYLLYTIELPFPTSLLCVCALLRLILHGQFDRMITSWHNSLWFRSFSLVNATNKPEHHVEPPPPTSSSSLIEQERKKKGLLGRKVWIFWSLSTNVARKDTYNYNISPR